MQRPNWKENLPEYWRNGNLRKYGMSMEAYEKLYLEQEGLCKVCKQQEWEGKVDAKGRKLLSVDHEHGTRPARVRGLLCKRCNKVLGLVRENVALFYALARYLENCKQ